ncbi:molybdenum cofactor sulfurase [Actinokineospora globicatena]|uniref:Molybdenum cofactor sulfurase n=1 Tax=Actinokineospora globicatena TaxID=103729 RepID=A0A9W6VCN1_9PSEU|nr:molybdenum cofactor sulfurase [Actinokineospora globicatena]
MGVGGDQVSAAPAKSSDSPPISWTGPRSALPGSVGGVITVVGLRSYPVKGCAGVEHVAVDVGLMGLAHDRAFLVVGPGGVGRTQRRDPRLAVVRPEVVGEKLVLRAPGFGEVSAVVDTEGPRQDVTMFGDPYRGIDQGDEVAGWLTEVLQAPSRLVRVPPEHHRVIEGPTSGVSGFADSAAVHLLSLASYRQLCERIGGAAVPLDRFRPNIVVDGLPAHGEDDLRHCAIGPVRLGFTRLAVRCAVVQVDQTAGTRAGPEPLRTLAGYRRAKTGVTFGTKLSVITGGPIALGDELVPDQV